MDASRILSSYRDAAKPVLGAFDVMKSAENEIDALLEQHWERLNEDLNQRITLLIKTSYESLAAAKKSFLEEALRQRSQNEELIANINVAAADKDGVEGDVYKFTTARLIQVLKSANYSDEAIESLQHADFATEEEVVDSVFETTPQGTVEPVISVQQAAYRVKGWSKIRYAIPLSAEVDRRKGLFRRVCVLRRPGTLTRKRKKSIV